MAINTCQRLNLKNNLNWKNRNRFMDTESIWTVARWERGWGMGEKVKGLSTNWLLQNSHGFVKYSIENIVNTFE